MGLNHAGYLPEFAAITEGKNHDVTVRSIYLTIAFIKFQSELTKGMQQILRLLQLNLFEKRDLIALLRGEPLHNSTPDIDQMALL